MTTLGRCQQQRASRPCGTCIPRNAARVSRAVRVAASSQPAAAEASRRQILLAGVSAAAVPTLLQQLPARAEEGFSTFLGLASPPTSYGGYGGNAIEEPKYSFEYPTEWKSETPSKVEKGTQGVDGRVVNPKLKDQRAFVITLGRAGEDNKSFKLTDLDSTLQGFAGADYALQDALSDATNINRSQREVGGITFYEYDIDSPDSRYLASIAVKGGKVFALLVRSPARVFGKSEKTLRHIVETFKLL